MRSNQTAVADALRELILAVEAYRHAESARLQLGLTESQAVSYLLARGSLPQGELGRALGLTTGSLTALVDRLERQNIAARYPHPTYRQRSMVALTADFEALVEDANDRLLHTLGIHSDHELTRISALLRELAAGLRAGSNSGP